MYKEILVRDRIAEGNRLLEKLKRNHFPVKKALWHFRPESERWEFVIATPVIDKVGPMAAYTRVQRLLGAIQPRSLSLTDVSLISPKGPKFEDFRNLGATPGRFDDGAATGGADDLVFENVYVYNV